MGQNNCYTLEQMKEINRQAEQRTEDRIMECVRLQLERKKKESWMRQLKEEWKNATLE